MISVIGLAATALEAIIDFGYVVNLNNKFVNITNIFILILFIFIN